MKNLTFGLRFSVFNLLIVSILGTLMRYKIAFSFPYLEQKHLQESHSHFAFYGWITSCIYILILRYLQKVSPAVNSKKYYRLIAFNLFASFGMLTSFIYGGYFWLSILFSSIALFTSFAYFFLLIKELKSIKENSKIWFLGGFFFAVLSSLGVFLLCYMMATKNILQDVYLASTYYYLHFQYNGFFIFSCIGLLIFSLKEAGAKTPENQNKAIFSLMFLGSLFGYGLSILWMELRPWIFTTIIISSFSQTFGTIKIYFLIKENWKNLTNSWSPIQRLIFIFSGVAFSIKIALQLGSNIPAISQFAFGFRNIVIAYLHLVLLMCISSFLIGQILGSYLFKVSRKLLIGIKLFLLGIFLNELFLGLNGILSIKYLTIPYSNEILLVISLLISISIILIFINLRTNDFSFK